MSVVSVQSSLNRDYTDKCFFFNLISVLLQWNINPLTERVRNKILNQIGQTNRGTEVHRLQKIKTEEKVTRIEEARQKPMDREREMINFSLCTKTRLINLSLCQISSKKFHPFSDTNKRNRLKSMLYAA